MNHPCKIHFHEDAAPLYGQLPKQYQRYVLALDPAVDEPVLTLLSQNAFYIDFTHGLVLRTRAPGGREAEPIDFPLASISFIEWYYGSDVPPPLTPHVGNPQPRPPDRPNPSRG